MTSSKQFKPDSRFITAGLISILISFFFVYDALIAIFFLMTLYIVKKLIDDGNFYSILILLSIPVVYSLMQVSLNVNPTTYYLMIISTFIVYFSKSFYKPISQLVTIRRDYITYFLIVLFIYAVLSTKFISTEKAYGALKLKYLFITIYTTFLVSEISLRNKSYSRIFDAYIFSGIVIIAVSLIYFWNIDTGHVLTDASIPNRLTLFKLNPISLGRVIVMFIFSTIYYLLELGERYKRKIINIIFITSFAIFAIYLMLLTASRGPLLGFVSGVIFLVFIRLKSSIKTIFGLILLILLIAAVISFAPASVQNRITQKDTGSNSTIMIRIILNVHAIEMFMKHKILGAGFGSFESTGWGYPHNIFTEALCELGIFFFLALVYLVVKLFILIRRNIDYIRSRNDIQVITAMFVCGFVNANFSGNIGNNLDFWLYTFLLYQILQKFEKNDLLT